MASHSNESKKSHDATKSPTDWDDWDFVITSDGFDGLLENLSGALSAYETKLYNVLGAIAAMAIHLRDHPKLWAAFCNHKFWKQVAGGRPKRDQYERSLNYVMRYSIGPTKKDRQNASRYVRAIAPLVEGGVKPAELPTRIAEEGGIVALIEKWKLPGDEGEDESDAERDNASDEDNSTGEERRKPRAPKQTRNGPVRPAPTVARRASGGSSKDGVYLTVKLLMSKKDRDDIIASDPVRRKLLLAMELLAIEDGEAVAKVDRLENLETREQARARLAE